MRVALALVPLVLVALAPAASASCAPADCVAAAHDVAIAEAAAALRFALAVNSASMIYHDDLSGVPECPMPFENPVFFTICFAQNPIGAFGLDPFGFVADSGPFAASVAENASTFAGTTSDGANTLVASLAGAPKAQFLHCDATPHPVCDVRFDTCNVPAAADPYGIVRKDVWIIVPGPILIESC